MSDLERFRAAYRRVEADGYNWQELDGVLYRMCAEMPDHSDPRQVIAKVGLINRGYRANLQMGRKSAEEFLAEALMVSDIDRHLASLHTLQTFDAATAPAVMNAHKALVEVCQQATGRLALSFASKYLSFHVPKVVPLFDSNAFKEGRKYVGRVANEPLVRGTTETYGWHAARVLVLADDLRANGIDPSMKLVDVVLYGAAGGRG